MGNVVGRHKGSKADLVGHKYLRLQETDSQEQAMQVEKLGEKNEEKVDQITLLPFEIMHQTFAQLPHEERLTTTSLVCKKFMDVNRTHIYKFIHINLGNPRGQGEDNPGLGEFGQCFTTLLKHEQLRGRVLSIALKVHHHDLYLQVQGHLENLLKHLKSLRELSLNPPPSSYDLPTNPMTTFLRLDFHYNRTTFWQGWPDFPAVPSLELKQFFYINHIRKLQIEHISFAPELHRDAFFYSQHRASIIEDLRFIDCSPQTTGKLPDLLLLPKSLKRFVLETRCPWSVAQTPGARPHTMNAQELYQALEPHSASLEELVVAFSDGASFLTNSTMCLAGWSNLTRLAIPEAFLVRGSYSWPLHEVLPSRLQELQIQCPLGKPLSPYAKASRIMRLTQLAGNKNASVCELKRVIVWHQGQDRDEAGQQDGLGDLQELPGLFASVGTEFECCFASAFAGTPFGESLGVKKGTGSREQGVWAFTLGASQPGLYYDESTQSVF